MEDFELIMSLLPEEAKMNFTSDDTASITLGDRHVTVVHSSKSHWVVNGKAVGFDDKSPEVVNTMLVPFILQELDGNKRF